MCALVLFKIQIIVFNGIKCIDKNKLAVSYGKSLKFTRYTQEVKRDDDDCNLLHYNETVVCFASSTIMPSCSISWGSQPDTVGPFGIDYAYIYECSPSNLNPLVLVVYFIWIVYLISLLAQTANNYLSPTLSEICKKLGVAYDVAGVTFLAFGNGAPDFFSLIASFSGGVDILVGVGALLGGSVFVCTVVVGSIALLSPCEVSKSLFLRDIGFHILATCAVSIIALVQVIYLPLVFMLFILYIAYVLLVVFGSNRGGAEISSDIPLTALANNSASLQTAFWYKDSRVVKKKPVNTVISPYSPPKESSDSNGGYSFLTLSEFPRTRHSLDTESKDDDNDRDEGITINLSGGTELAWDEIVQDDYYSANILTSNERIVYADDEENNLDNSDISLDQSMHGGSQDGDDSISLQQSLLSSGGRRRLPSGGWKLQQYSSVLTSLYWQQWAIRRQFHKRGVLDGRAWQEASTFERLQMIIDFPASFARDATIPTLDETQWSKVLAVMHPIIGPLFAMFVIGLIPSAGIIILIFLVGSILALLIYLTTSTSRPPHGAIFAATWALTAFGMCVLWIYALAGELITVLSVLGDELHLPPAFLGLTVLAWGNSIGDFFTNTAVAKQGLGTMALAGCYGGPVFNLLMGFGSSLFYATVQSYPKPFPVILDASSILSLSFLLFSLTSTVALVYLRGYRMDRQCGIYLLSLYALYSTAQGILVLSSY